MPLKRRVGTVNQSQVVDEAYLRSTISSFDNGQVEPVARRSAIEPDDQPVRQDHRERRNDSSIGQAAMSQRRKVPTDSRAEHAAQNAQQNKVAMPAAGL